MKSSNQSKTVFVNLRKLRVLLESIGDMEVVTENNFLRIKWGTSVFCDYHTLMTCTKQFEQEKSEELEVMSFPSLSRTLKHPNKEIDARFRS